MELLGSKISFGIQYPGRPSGFELSEPESEQSTKTQPRILVVDDERLLADTTADILRRAGFEAKTASDGFEALEMMAAFFSAVTSKLRHGIFGLSSAGILIFFATLIHRYYRYMQHALINKKTVQAVFYVGLAIYSNAQTFVE